MKKFSFCFEYEIGGKNFPLLISNLNARKIDFKNLKINEKGNLEITIDAKDRNKFIAIVKNCWYNIRVKEKGFLALLRYCVKKAGVFLGIAFFICGSFIADGFILGIKIKGDGDFFKKDVYSVLEKNGVKKYTRFSSVDLKGLSEELYGENSLICYASCKKSGNYLVFTVHKANESPAKIDVSVKEIVSGVDGTIYSAEVLRGNALKNVGDEVKKGEVLVSGTKQTDYGEYSSFVLARVKVLTCYHYEQSYSGKADERELAVIKAKINCGQEEYYDCEVTENGDKIKVKLFYLVTYETGGFS